MALSVAAVAISSLHPAIIINSIIIIIIIIECCLLPSTKAAAYSIVRIYGCRVLNDFNCRILFNPLNHLCLLHAVDYDDFNMTYFVVFMTLKCISTLPYLDSQTAFIIVCLLFGDSKKKFFRPTWTILTIELCYWWSCQNCFLMYT